MIKNEDILSQIKQQEFTTAIMSTMAYNKLVEMHEYDELISGKVSGFPRLNIEIDNSLPNDKILFTTGRNN